MVIGAILALCSLGLLGAAGTAVWAQTAKGPGGYLNLGTKTYTTGGYAVASDKAELPTATGGWSWASALFGTVRLAATLARGTAPVFLGIAPAAAAAHYLAGVNYSSITGNPRHEPRLYCAPRRPARPPTWPRRHLGRAYCRATKPDLHEPTVTCANATSNAPYGPTRTWRDVALSCANGSSCI